MKTRAIPDGLAPSADLDHCVRNADEVLLVVPSHAFAEVVARVAEIRPGLKTLSWATKGFDPNSGGLLSEVVSSQLPGCDLAVVTTQPGSKSQENVQRRGFELLYTRAVLVLEP